MNRALKKLKKELMALKRARGWGKKPFYIVKFEDGSKIPIFDEHRLYPKLKADINFIFLCLLPSGQIVEVEDPENIAHECLKKAIIPPPPVISPEIQEELISNPSPIQESLPEPMPEAGEDQRKDPQVPKEKVIDWTLSRRGREMVSQALGLSDEAGGLSRRVVYLDFGKKK